MKIKKKNGTPTSLGTVILNLPYAVTVFSTIPNKMYKTTFYSHDMSYILSINSYSTLQCK